MKHIKCQRRFNEIYAHLKPKGKEHMRHLVLNIEMHHFEAMDMMLTQHQDMFYKSVNKIIGRAI